MFLLSALARHFSLSVFSLSLSIVFVYFLIQLHFNSRKVIMSNVDHSLVEIEAESLPSLRDSFKVNWPEHVMAYNLIDNLIERFKKHPEHREFLKIYSIDGDIADSTFIAVMVRKMSISERVDN